MRLMIFVALLLIGCAVQANPPYSVTATFSPPTTGGAPTGYRLYQGCVSNANKGSLVGTVTSGQTFAGLLTADGTYSFCVTAVNATGESPISNIATVNINDFEPAPGAPANFNISVTCDDSCSVNVTISP